MWHFEDAPNKIFHLNAYSHNSSRSSCLFTDAFWHPFTVGGCQMTRRASSVRNAIFIHHSLTYSLYSMLAHFCSLRIQSNWCIKGPFANLASCLKKLRDKLERVAIKTPEMINEMINNMIKTLCRNVSHLLAQWNQSSPHFWFPLWKFRPQPKYRKTKITCLGLK